ncbi:MAG: hypothetical protein Q7V88_08180 [Actinomycetota bacterium]|nr:hypothetical protein [Actinomycetota bacterium]
MKMRHLAIVAVVTIAVLAASCDDDDYGDNPGTGVVTTLTPNTAAP